VVVAMPIGIGAFAEDVQVLLRAPFGAAQFMGGAEALTAGDVDDGHGGKGCKGRMWTARVWKPSQGPPYLRAFYRPLPCWKPPTCVPRPMRPATVCPNATWMPRG